MQVHKTRANYKITEEKNTANYSSSKNDVLGPVAQSIVSLTSLLMTNSLTVVSKVFSNTLIFLLQKCE